MTATDWLQYIVVSIFYGAIIVGIIIKLRGGKDERN